MIKAWDLPTRVFHWLLVLLLLFSWISAKYGDAFLVWHKWNGYAILTLLLSRIVWGLGGSTTSRFVTFVYGIRQMIAYSACLINGTSRHYLSHNPLGGLMVVMMMGFILLQITTGLFSSDEIFGHGPFSQHITGTAVQLMTAYHQSLFYLIMALVAIHVLAVLYHQLIRREKIIEAMFTGKKPKHNYQDIQQIRWKSVYLALAVVLVIAGVVTSIASGLEG